MSTRQRQQNPAGRSSALTLAPCTLHLAPGTWSRYTSTAASRDRWPGKGGRSEQVGLEVELEMKRAETEIPVRWFALEHRELGWNFTMTVGGTTYSIPDSSTCEGGWARH